MPLYFFAVTDDGEPSREKTVLSLCEMMVQRAPLASVSFEK
jgi:hypothetical protein